MSKEDPKARDYADLAQQAEMLGSEGQELKKKLWENGVYLGADGYVYHILAQQSKGRINVKIAGKRSVGEYLRWVDGLFRPGELPGESSGLHYRAARKLRELM